MNQAAINAYRYYLSKGIPPQVAAGIVGNLYVESGGFAPDVISGQRRGDQGSAYAGAQWRGQRFANLQAYAQKQGADWRNLPHQLDFVLEEMNAKSPYADKIAAANYQRLLAAQNPAQATHLFMSKFERAHPSPKMNHIDRRVNIANQLYAMDPNAVAVAANTPATAAYQGVEQAAANVPAQGMAAATQALGSNAVLGQLAANQAASAQAAQAASTANVAESADPFGGLLQAMLAAQQTKAPPPATGGAITPPPEVDPEQQTALTSHTPNVYANRARRRRIVI